MNITSVFSKSVDFRALTVPDHSIECLRANNPSYYIHHIAPTPLLMVVASNDNVTPADLALQAYSRALEPKELHILSGAGHFGVYSGPYFERNADRQTEFLSRTLCKKERASKLV